MQIQWKNKENISKTKGRHGASLVSYCLAKVNNKGHGAIRQKNVRGRIKRNGAKGKHKKIYLGKQKNVGVNAMKSLRWAKESRWEKAWDYRVEQKKVSRKK